MSAASTSRAGPAVRGRAARALGRTAAGTECGAAAVEFALVCGLWCVLLIGAVELARMAWVWNAAVEATRHGARLAVVCGIGDPRVAQRMAQRLPGLMPQHVRIDYLATGQPVNACGPADCEAVRVAIVDVEHRTFVPLLARTVGLPPMVTTLRRESLDGTANAVCQ